MTEHTLTAAVDTVAASFSRDRAPVLTVDPGDEVTVHSLDVLGHLERFGSGGAQGVPRLLGAGSGLSVCGPIEVRGAEPGTMLAVHLVALEPDDFGWTMASWQHSELERRLGVEAPETTWLTWDLDVAAGRARSAVGPSVELSPFLGVIGLSPAEPGEHSVVPPHAAGGNLDCRALVAGSTLYLPVQVPGAMLHVGDGHGAQGDGEVSGTAVECAMRSTLTVDVVTDRPVPTLHAETPSGRITFGLSPDLNEAAAQALEAMLTWIQAEHDVTRPTALALASACVDLRITQIATPVWGVHAVLPPGALD